MENFRYTPSMKALQICFSSLRKLPMVSGTLLTRKGFPSTLTDTAIFMLITIVQKWIAVISHSTLNT